MAKYDREFLVLYLRDIYALYLAEAKIRKCLSEVQKEIPEYDWQERLPSFPHEPAYASAPSKGLLIIGYVLYALIPVVVLGKFFKLVFLESLSWWLILVLCVVAFIGGRMMMNEYSEDLERFENNDYRRICYEHDLLKTKEMEAEVKRRNTERKERVRYLSGEILKYREDLENLQRIQEFLYEINIIPSAYRNLYAIAYLYDWFNTSGATDLDHALSMFVLEEIKSRLDHIIAQQSEMILNQRIMIAKQQEAIDLQERHNQIMLRKLNQLQATEEERLRYDRMIEGNTAATAFFAAANYLK